MLRLRMRRWIVDGKRNVLLLKRRKECLQSMELTDSYIPGLSADEVVMIRRKIIISEMSVAFGS